VTDDAFKGLYLVGFIASWLLRMPHFRRLRARGVSVIDDAAALRYMTPLEKLLRILALMGNLVIPAVYIFTRWLDFAGYHVPTWVGAVGAAIFAAGLWVQWRARVDLGHNLTLAAVTTERQSLVSIGAYRYIRHPIFAGFWLQAAGQVLLLHNWIAGFAGLVLFLPVYMYRVRREEQMMLERFGGKYRAYMDRTGRVLPRFGVRPPTSPSPS
jgi:protein-S-isoprenylcysteine O-methyltransferase Ste14